VEAIVAQENAARSLEVAQQRSTDAAVSASVATAVRVSTVNHLADVGTAQAIQQEQAEFHAQQTSVRKTEDAREQAVWQAERTSRAKESATAAAVATDASHRRQKTATSARATDSAFQAAIVGATATWQAQEPTRQAQARKLERDKQQAVIDEQVRQSQIQTSLRLAPLVRAIEVLWFPLFGAGILVIALVIMFRVGLAFITWAQVQTLQSMASITASFVVKDVHGNPLGYFQMGKAQGELIFHPFTPPVLEIEAEAPAVLTDARDRLIAEPKIGNLIYRSDLLAFVEEILQTSDWTQTTWTREGHNRLPRGYILSKDTRDSAGNVAAGGYSNLMQTFVDKHIILGRKKGASGVWNPNVPKEVDAVMDILTNRAPIPPLPHSPSVYQSPVSGSLVSES
jgi:hypothetical protein